MIDDEAELDLNKVEENMVDDVDDEDFGEEESLLDLNAMRGQKVKIIIPLYTLLSKQFFTNLPVLSCLTSLMLPVNLKT